MKVDHKQLDAANIAVAATRLNISPSEVAMGEIAIAEAWEFIVKNEPAQADAISMMRALIGYIDDLYRGVGAEFLLVERD